MEVGGKGGASDGRGGGVSVVRGPPARGSSGVVGAAGSCGGSSSAPRRGQKRACARTRAEGRGRGAGERNGSGGGPSSWHERAATVAGGGGAYRASESGIGAGLGGAHLERRQISSDPTSTTACQTRGGRREVVESRGRSCSSGGYAGAGGRCNVHRARGGGLLTEALATVRGSQGGSGDSEPGSGGRRPPRKFSEKRAFKPDKSCPKNVQNTHTHTLS